MEIGRTKLIGLLFVAGSFVVAVYLSVTPVARYNTGCGLPIAAAFKPRDGYGFRPEYIYVACREASLAQVLVSGATLIAAGGSGLFLLRRSAGSNAAGEARGRASEALATPPAPGTPTGWRWDGSRWVPDGPPAP